MGLETLAVFNLYHTFLGNNSLHIICFRFKTFTSLFPGEFQPPTAPAHTGTLHIWCFLFFIRGSKDTYRVVPSRQWDRVEEAYHLPSAHLQAIVSFFHH